MPFTGAGHQNFQRMPATWTNLAANTSASDLAACATPGAATWSPSSASSAVASHVDSSAAQPTNVTEINVVSSPPTSHAASPSRTRSSPLGPSLAANVIQSHSGACDAGKATRALSVAQTEAYVANSDPEDGENGGEPDGAETPQHLRSPSPTHSSSHQDVPATLDGVEHAASVCVQLPASSPSSRPPREDASSKRKPRKQQARRGSDATDDDAGEVSVDDDAAYAAALAAQEETLARRRPARGARKEVSYIPSCDLDGRPFASKKPRDQANNSIASSSAIKPNSAASKENSAIKRVKGKRKSRVFSDDDDEDGDGVGPSSSNKSKGAAADPIAESAADHTDEDIGFKARDRKKGKVGKPVPTRSDNDDEQEENQARRRKVPMDRSPRRKRERAHENDEEAPAVNSDHDDGILTPPAPTSPRRSSRKSVPSPEKQQLKETVEGKVTKKGKGKSKQKTFDLDGEKDQDEEEKGVVAVGDAANGAEDDDQPPRKSSRKGAASSKPSKSDEVAPPEEEDEDEVDEETKQSSDKTTPSTVASTSTSKPTNTATLASPAAASISTARPAPTSVAIKRITTSSSSSPSLSPSSPATVRSFFGKPLTTLLNAGSVRRPGLTRKTNIPSLLNHRGAPKPPAAKLAVSKRRLQDDDYEYDAEYEAMIAKGKKGSDDEDDDEEASDAEGQKEVEVEIEEYD